HEPLLSLTHERHVARAQGAGASAGRASEEYARFHRAGAWRGPGEGPVPAASRGLETGSPRGGGREVTLRREGAAAHGAPPSRGGGLIVVDPGAAGGQVGLETESVIIPMRSKGGLSHTLCVSSQVGCAMGCVFCETAQMGLLRSLTAAEIVAQWWAARHHV